MRRIVLFLASACALLLPTAASATTFCVAGPDDCTGDAVSAANFESDVLQVTSDGQPDVAILNEQTYVDPERFEANNNDPLTIIGQGDATVLTSSEGAAGVLVLDTQNGGDPITFRNITIRVPADFVDNAGIAVRARDDIFEDVRIETAKVGAHALERFGGSILRDSVVTGVSGGTFDMGVRNGTSGTSATVEDSRIDADNAILSIEPDASIVARRSVLTADDGHVAQSLGGDVRVENSIARGGGDSAFLSQASGDDPATLVADHVTMIGDGTSAALESRVFNGEEGNTTVTLRNSIARGFGHFYERVAPEADPLDGDAFVTVAYSDFTLGASEDEATDDGAFDGATGNVDVDPKFVGGDDRHLAADSPVIDAGDPAEGGLAEDLDTAPRPNDGNRDRTAIRDMGAFEFQAAPPDPLPADPPPGGGGTPPPPGPLLPPAATFGSQTLVTLTGLGLDRRGRVRIRVRNRNTFAITGAVAVNSVGAIPRTAVRLGRRTFTVGAGARRTVAVRLSKRAKRALRRRGRLAVRLVATVRAPSGTARTVRKRVTVRRRAN